MSYIERVLQLSVLCALNRLLKQLLFNNIQLSRHIEFVKITIGNIFIIIFITLLFQECVRSKKVWHKLIIFKRVLIIRRIILNKHVTCKHTLIVRFNFKEQIFVFLTILHNSFIMFYLQILVDLFALKLIRPFFLFNFNIFTQFESFQVLLGCLNHIFYLFHVLVQQKPFRLFLLRILETHFVVILRRWLILCDFISRGSNWFLFTQLMLLLKK